jgi:hypothetical protein
VPDDGGRPGTPPGTGLASTPTPSPHGHRITAIVADARDADAADWAAYWADLEAGRELVAAVERVIAAFPESEIIRFERPKADEP